MSTLKEFEKGICAIVRKEFEPLLKILGIKEVYIANDWIEARSFLDKLMKRSDLAVIIIQQSLIPHDISFADLNAQNIYPIVVVIPDNKESLSVPLHTFYREIIRRYIGYEIYLEV